MTDQPSTEMSLVRLRFMCEQLREWGGIPESEIAAIYDAKAAVLAAIAAAPPVDRT